MISFAYRTLIVVDREKNSICDFPGLHLLLEDLAELAELVDEDDDEAPSLNFKTSYYDELLQKLSNGQYKFIMLPISTNPSKIEKILEFCKELEKDDSK